MSNKIKRPASRFVHTQLIYSFNKCKRGLVTQWRESFVNHDAHTIRLNTGRPRAGAGSDGPWRFRHLHTPCQHKDDLAVLLRPREWPDAAVAAANTRSGGTQELRYRGRLRGDRCVQRPQEHMRMRAPAAGPTLTPCSRLRLLSPRQASLTITDSLSASFFAPLGPRSHRRLAEALRCRGSLRRPARAPPTETAVPKQGLTTGGAKHPSQR